MTPKNMAVLQLSVHRFGLPVHKKKPVDDIVSPSTKWPEVNQCKTNIYQSAEREIFGGQPQRQMPVNQTYISWVLRKKEYFIDRDLKKKERKKKKVTIIQEKHQQTRLALFIRRLSCYVLLFCYFFPYICVLLYDNKILSLPYIRPVGTLSPCVFRDLAIALMFEFYCCCEPAFVGLVVENLLN